MILTVDIGNTSISFGLVKGKKVLVRFAMETELAKGRHEVLTSILKQVRKEYADIDKGIICSVVPRVTKVIAAEIKRDLGVSPIVVGQDVVVPIKNNYREPSQVGQDRLVVAYAAKCLYGAPAIIIDFGTAITFDVVSHKGAYEGGLIVPGIKLSAESLFRQTALLPHIDEIKSPRSLIGKDTQSSILSGIFYGYGTMCAGLIDSLSKKLQGEPKVIVTGGYIRLMKKFIAHKIHKIDKDLVLKGMALVHNNKKF